MLSVRMYFVPGGIVDGKKGANDIQAVVPRVNDVLDNGRSWRSMSFTDYEPGLS